MIHFIEVYMINLNEFFSKVFLFAGLPEEKLSAALSECEPELRSYRRGDIIYSPESFEKEIGFVYSGECEVKRRKCDGSELVLNSLKSGESFGILAVLSNEDEFPTVISAKSTVEVFFIKKSKLMRLIRHYPTVAMNVINFLTKKISFLNKKVATFSSESVEEKLRSFLLAEYKKCGATEFALNCKKCSEIISAGRASVYRGLDALTQTGLIKYENKKIFILDLNGLERTKK